MMFESWQVVLEQTLKTAVERKFLSLNDFNFYLFFDLPPLSSKTCSATRSIIYKMNLCPSHPDKTWLIFQGTECVVEKSNKTCLWVLSGSVKVLSKPPSSFIQQGPHKHRQKTSFFVCRFCPWWIFSSLTTCLSSHSLVDHVDTTLGFSATCWTGAKLIGIFLDYSPWKKQVSENWIFWKISQDKLLQWKTKMVLKKNNKNLSVFCWLGLVTSLEEVNGLPPIPVLRHGQSSCDVALQTGKACFN